MLLSLRNGVAKSPWSPGKSQPTFALGTYKCRFRSRQTITDVVRTVRVEPCHPFESLIVLGGTSPFFSRPARTHAAPRMDRQRFDPPNRHALLGTASTEPYPH